MHARTRRPTNCDACTHARAQIQTGIRERKRAERRERCSRLCVICKIGRSGTRTECCASLARTVHEEHRSTLPAATVVKILFERRIERALTTQSLRGTVEVTAPDEDMVLCVSAWGSVRAGLRGAHLQSKCLMRTWCCVFLPVRCCRSLRGKMTASDAMTASDGVLVWRVSAHWCTVGKGISQEAMKTKRKQT